ncbi:hypothetical protein J3A83DRAFT_4093958 [Scleroderma citrinum]
MSLSFTKLSRHSFTRGFPRRLCLSRGFVRPYSSTKHPTVTSLTATCLSCGAQLPTRLPVCPSCNYIAGVHRSIPYHELLGLPYNPNPFVVDTAVLKRQYLDAQRICHPDAWATKSEVLKEAALELSNIVNAAYKTLTSPLHRVEYILHRNGIETLEEDQLDDIELISEIMEVREEVDNVQPGNTERLLALQDENNAKISELAGSIEEWVGRQDWRETKSAAVRLKYLEGIQDAINRRLVE